MLCKQIDNYRCKHYSQNWFSVLGSCQAAIENQGPCPQASPYRTLHVTNPLILVLTKQRFLKAGTLKTPDLVCKVCQDCRPRTTHFSEQDYLYECNGLFSLTFHEYDASRRTSPLMRGHKGLHSYTFLQSSGFFLKQTQVIVSFMQSTGTLMQFLCVISQDSDQSAFGESILKMAHESFFLGWSVNSISPRKPHNPQYSQVTI